MIMLVGPCNVCSSGHDCGGLTTDNGGCVRRSGGGGGGD